MSKLLKEPLCHFLVLGAALFGDKFAAAPAGAFAPELAGTAAVVVKARTPTSAPSESPEYPSKAIVSSACRCVMRPLVASTTITPAYAGFFIFGASVVPAACATPIR